MSPEAFDIAGLAELFERELLQTRDAKRAVRSVVATVLARMKDDAAGPAAATEARHVVESVAALFGLEPEQLRTGTNAPLAAVKRARWLAGDLLRKRGLESAEIRKMLGLAKAPLLPATYKRRAVPDGEKAARIVAAVAEECQIAVERLRFGGRKEARAISDARFVAMRLLVDAGFRYQYVAMVLGMNDHSPVNYGLRQVARRRDLQERVTAVSMRLAADDERVAA